MFGCGLEAEAKSSGTGSHAGFSDGVLSSF